MKTTAVPIQTATGGLIMGKQALIWGNNAAWLCCGCGELLGNRT